MENNGKQPPAWMLGVSGQKGKAKPKWMQYYQTGENQRRTVRLPGGETTRLAPNSYISPLQQQYDPLMDFLRRMRGAGRDPASGIAGVRG